jgi:CTP synthase
MNYKMIFVTGGVVSSIGKGITSASLGRLLTNRGYRVHALKIDPYINVDAGTMNPFQHGEVFVTNDGAETDLDLGNYERFLGTELSGLSNVTSGAVYRAVIEKEREGRYLGETVQLIPHITNEIKERIYRLARESRADVLICEIGGTIGDFETPPFVEAIRQIRMEQGAENTLFMHVTLVVTVAWGEVKTKPTQHSVRALLTLGVMPDILICRTKHPFSSPAIREKISQSCGVPLNAVIEAADADYIEEIPLLLEKQGLGDLVVRRLGLEPKPSVSNDWATMVERLKNPADLVRIAVVGKYTAHGDAYLSVQEALKHAGIANNAHVQIKWVESESLNEASNLDSEFADVSGILVPGGYGIRGIEGMIHAVRYAREKKVPYLGLCLGMQCMVIEFARHVAGLKGANSTEFDPETPHPVIAIMEHQRRITEKGGNQRLGIYPCVLTDGTAAHSAYKQPIIVERHRHRYEVNNAYRQRLLAKGLVFSGLSPGGDLVEISELPNHPFMLGSQFHPEFRSKPLEPHPLFTGFVKAALEYQPPKVG